MLQDVGGENDIDGLIRQRNMATVVIVNGKEAFRGVIAVWKVEGNDVEAMIRQEARLLPGTRAKLENSRAARQ